MIENPFDILISGKSLSYHKKDDYSAASSFNRTMYCKLLSHFEKERNLNEFKENFEPFINDISDKVVLDIGCGLGSLFIHNMLVFEKPKKLIHLDIDINVFYRQMLKKHHPKIAEKVYDWSNDYKIVGNIEFIPLKNNSVDIVHKYFLLGNADSSLVDREVHRILKSDGLYITDDSMAEYDFEFFDIVNTVNFLNKYIILKPK